MYIYVSVRLQKKELKSEAHEKRGRKESILGQRREKDIRE